MNKIVDIDDFQRFCFTKFFSIGLPTERFLNGISELSVWFLAFYISFNSSVGVRWILIILSMYNMLKGCRKISKALRSKAPLSFRIYWIMHAAMDNDYKIYEDAINIMLSNTRQGEWLFQQYLNWKKEAN